MGEKNYKEIKKLLSSREALGTICFNKHKKKGLINCVRMSELLKIPIDIVKETCVKLEASGILLLHRAGYDLEAEFLEQEDDRIKQLIDEAIWENKQEYGTIYKRLVTAELMDFMDENK
jgi:hypothetical protein